MEKKYTLLFYNFIASLLVIFSLCPLIAQNNDSIVPGQVEQIDTVAFQIAEGKKPVKDDWYSTMLVDMPTSYLPSKGSFEIYIQHRFSNLDDGIHDLFGIYGASNIRLAVTYSILDRLMIGFGTEKDHKYQELFVKAKLLEQTRNGKIPLSLTFYGNTALSARSKSYWGNDYKFIDKLSYHAQLIAARKFHDIFSLQVGVSYSHLNKTESVKQLDTIINQADSANSLIRTSYHGVTQNDIIGISAAARIKFYRNMSVILEYDQGFLLKKASSMELKPKPNVALGLEIGTATHAFQVFASSYRALVPQHNFAYNQFDFTKLKGLMIGFNIIVRLN
ncbi:MAG TPA: DUF5777 family beta-barrel protein [Bacteroidales bacterium]|nr:DUF5777 family beta-barrel protein [Bacteroidales bacterium]